MDDCDGCPEESSSTAPEKFIPVTTDCCVSIEGHTSASATGFAKVMLDAPDLRFVQHVIIGPREVTQQPNTPSAERLRPQPPPLITSFVVLQV